MKPNTAIVQEADESVAQLTEKIKAEWLQYEESGRRTLSHVKSIARRLCKLRKAFSHGTWEDFVIDELHIPLTTAKRWMRQHDREACQKSQVADLETQLSTYMQDTESNQNEESPELASENGSKLPGWAQAACQTTDPHPSRAERLGITEPKSFPLPDPEDEEEKPRRKQNVNAAQSSRNTEVCPTCKRPL